MPQTIRCFPALPVLAAVVFCAAAASAQTPTPRPWKVSFDGSHGELSGQHSDQGEYTFTVDKIVNRRVTLTGAVDQHDRFDELDTQAIGGVQVGFPTRRSLLNATYTEGFGAQEVSRHGVDVQFSFQAHKHVRPEFEIEYDRYVEDYYLSKTTFGVALLPSQRLQSELKLVVSAASEDKGGTAGTFGVSFAVNDRLTIKGGAGYGHEHFLAKAVTEVKRELTALGINGEVDWSYLHHNTLKIAWEYQDRKTAYSTNLLKFGWAKSF